MRLACLLLLAVLVLFVPASVRSQPSACDVATIDNFNVRNSASSIIWAVPDMECIEYFDIAVSTPHGERSIRAIGDINVDTFLPAGGIPAIESAVHSVAGSINALGDYKIGNIVILISPVGPRAPSLIDVDGENVWKHSRIAADANPRALEDTGVCHIRLFAMNPIDNRLMKQIVAHEIFHCVQYSSLRTEQLLNYLPWWVEGSAELFANYVFPEPTRNDRAPKFHRSVSEQVPVYRMQYEAMFLFLWYNERTGIGGLLPLLRNMATSRSDTAQHAVLRNMLADEQWLEFAEDFDDGNIRYPDGRAANFGPPLDGEQWQITETSNHQRILKPFVIMPGWVDYSCGLWQNRPAPAVANIALQKDGEQIWNVWPDQNDCRAEGTARYRTMALHTGDRNMSFGLHAERRFACNSCVLAETVIDQCMVGTWLQTGGGPMEWLQRNLRRAGAPAITRNNMGQLEMTMRDDGTFTSRAVGIDYQLTIPDRRRGPTVNDNFGQVGGTTGRWSASGGRLFGCFDSGGDATGVANVRYPNGMSRSSAFPGGGVAGIDGQTSYTCSETTMSTSSPMPRGGPMTHQFRRISPPVPRTGG